VVLGSTQSLT